MTYIEQLKEQKRQILEQIDRLYEQLLDIETELEEKENYQLLDELGVDW